MPEPTPGVTNGTQTQALGNRIAAGRMRMANDVASAVHGVSGDVDGLVGVYGPPDTAIERICRTDGKLIRIPRFLRCERPGNRARCRIAPPKPWPSGRMDSDTSLMSALSSSRLNQALGCREPTGNPRICVVDLLVFAAPAVVLEVGKMDATPVSSGSSHSTMYDQHEVRRISRPWSREPLTEL